MRFRSVIEIGVMLFGAHPFLPRMQVGQHVTVDGNRGRFVGVSRGGIVWIVWPNTCGRSRVNEALRSYHRAIKEA